MGQYGLQAVDLTDPTEPVIVTDDDVPDEAEHLVIAGELAYAADRRFGLRLFDLRQGTSLEGLAFRAREGLAIDGERAFNVPELRRMVVD